MTFAQAPIRQWIIIQLPNGAWRGELREGPNLHRKTEEGPFFLVRDAVEERRQGLPIVVRGWRRGL